MSRVSTSKFWEIEGQSASGEWFGIFQYTSRHEATLGLAWVLDNCDKGFLDRWEDFRLAPPVGYSADGTPEPRKTEKKTRRSTRQRVGS